MTVNNDLNLEKNFRNALPSPQPLDLADFSQIKVADISGVKLDRDEKQVYANKFGQKWMIDFSWDPKQEFYRKDASKTKGYSNQPALERYIAGGLYKLVLGNAAPREELFRHVDGKIYMGSEFIDSFEPIRSLESVAALLLRSNERQTTLPIIFDQEEMINVGTVLSIMILLDENDAHQKNIGKILNNDGSFSLAKVDHDSSDGMSDNNIRSSADQLTYNSTIKSEYDILIQNTSELLKGMKNIRDIPDSMWRQVVIERINAFKSIIEVEDDFDEEKAVAKFNHIKNMVPNYIEGLLWESAITSGDTRQVDELLFLGYDINSKYYYVGLKGDGDPITPVEMAAKTNNPQILDYIYQKSLVDSNLKARLVEDSKKYHFYKSMTYLVMLDDSIFTNKECLDLAITLEDTTLLKQIISTRGPVALEPTSEVLGKVLSSGNVLAYQLLSEDNKFTSADYLRDLHIVYRDYEENKNLVNLLMNKEVGTHEEALKKWSILDPMNRDIYVEDIPLSNILAKVKDISYIFKTQERILYFMELNITYALNAQFLLLEHIDNTADAYPDVLRAFAHAFIMRYIKHKIIDYPQSLIDWTSKAISYENNDITSELFYKFFEVIDSQKENIRLYFHNIDILFNVGFSLFIEEMNKQNKILDVRKLLDIKASFEMPLSIINKIMTVFVRSNESQSINKVGFEIIGGKISKEDQCKANKVLLSEPVITDVIGFVQECSRLNSETTKEVINLKFLDQSNIAIDSGSSRTIFSADENHNLYAVECTGVIDEG